MNREEEINKLFEENKKLVYYALKRFNIDSPKYKRMGMEREDFQQIGFIGLYNAARDFNKNKGYNFSTYAVPMILGEIHKSIRDDNIIRTPREAIQIATKISKRELDTFPKKEDIMKEFNVTKYIAKAAEFYFNLKYSSFESPIKGKEKDMFLSDILPSEFNLQESVENKELIQERVNSLDELERKVLLKYLFEEKGQVEIAKEIGCSQPHVGRLYKRALKNLREEEIVNA